MTYDVEALIKHHTADCMKLTHGKCSTRACLVRGGYVGPGPVDYSVATCEALETVEALRAGHSVVTTTEEACPGHIASENDPKVCGRCGTHIDSLRLSEDAP